MKLIGPLLFAAAISLASPAFADRDHDDARRAVELRQALPLSRITEIALRAVPGEVVEVELDRDHGRLIYEIEVLARNGRVRTVEIDARTGAVLEVEDDD